MLTISFVQKVLEYFYVKNLFIFSQENDHWHQQMYLKSHVLSDICIHYTVSCTFAVLLYSCFSSCQMEVGKAFRKFMKNYLHEKLKVVFYQRMQILEMFCHKKVLFMKFFV